jgi:zinc transport system ATP-binding protein
MPVLITLQDVTVQYGAIPVLTGVNLKVAKGEIVTIVGPNGSGKSSLLRVLTGALKPKKGSRLHAVGLKMGYVPQKLSLDPTFPITVRRMLDIPKRIDHAEAARVSDLTGISQIWDSQIANLSGGQLQRVMLARAIVGAPDVLLLDEPTQGLDQPGAAAFYQLIADLRDTMDCAVIMVSHDLHVVMSASDRVICLNGHICCEGTPDVVSTAPEYRALFGTGTKGALALYRHDHDHSHDHDHDHGHAH